MNIKEKREKIKSLKEELIELETSLQKDIDFMQMNCSHQNEEYIDGFLYDLIYCADCEKLLRSY